MNRSLFWLGTLLLSAAVVGWAQARTPANPDTEPHHRLVFANDQVRVFAVVLPAGQEVYVRHQHNFLTVTLEDSRLVMWAEGSNPVIVFTISAGYTRFFFGGPALGMRNDSTAGYRNITVEFLDPQVTTWGYQYNRGPDQPHWDYGSNALAPPVDDQSGFVHSLSLQRAVVRDVRLLAGALLAAPDQPAHELFIPVSDLDLAPPDGEDLKKSSGEAFWLSKRTTGLANQGKASARFVVVELKTPIVSDVEGKQPTR